MNVIDEMKKIGQLVADAGGRVHLEIDTRFFNEETKVTVTTWLPGGHDIKSSAHSIEDALHHLRTNIRAAESWRKTR
jgi:hypothetical protein